MKIGIIGAGFTGLTAALKLSRNGNEVTIFESSDRPGGLALGFRENKWIWPLESHYHHLFVSDYSIRKLAKSVNHKIYFKETKTKLFYDGQIHRFDSVTSFIKFSRLSIISKARLGLVLIFLRLTPFWKPLEKVTALKFLKSSMGDEAYRILWEPLFKNKFGKYYKIIPASWFWARIKKRSTKLGYPKGGFLSLAQNISKYIVKEKGKVIYNTQVMNVKSLDGLLQVSTNKKEKFTFDKIICTLPTPNFFKISNELPKSYIKKYKPLKGIGVINLVLELNKKFFKDGTYWLNINDISLPFLVVVEHTNFANQSKYNNSNILYIGKYLDTGDDFYKKNEKEIFKIFLNNLLKINPRFRRSWVKNFWIFKAPFVQPIVTTNYSSKIPPLKTPVPNLYLANIQQVYPWDRGTNYAVELGEKVAKIVIKNKVF